jgi:23S rRNA pseudouridine2605 synthase
MRIAVLKKTRVLTTLLVTLREGRNRHIRRALALVQLPVRRLRRIRIGPVRLGSLKRGGWRRLTPAEVAALRQDPTALPVKKHPKRRKSAPSGRRRGGAAGARRKRERP